jgi:hypothetical protein
VTDGGEADDLGLSGRNLTPICTGGAGPVACVYVDDGRGPENDGLSSQQISDFSGAYESFIRNNDGLNISGYGIETRGFASSRGNMVSVASQFVGSTLGEKGWGLIVAAEDNRFGTSYSLTSETVARIDLRYDENRARVIMLNFGNIYADLNNPSELGRALLHELRHHQGSGSHEEVDEWARNHLKSNGLAGGGCSAVGYTRVLRWKFGGYPGC